MDIGALLSTDVKSQNRKLPAWGMTGLLLIYVIAAVAIFWPRAPWNSAELPNAPFSQNGTGDPVQMTWFLEWIPYALRHGLNVFHTNVIDYPQGANLADNTLTPLLGLLAMPFTLTLGPVAAFNILLRLAFALSASSMFLVLRNWCRWPAAFAAGLFYGFGPYMASQGQSHLDLVFVPIPPLIVWLFYELLVAQRRNPVKLGLWLGTLAGAQALIDPELLTMTLIVVAIGGLVAAIANRQLLGPQLQRFLKAALPGVIVFAVLCSYFAWSLLRGPGHIHGTVLPLRQLNDYRADLLGLIYPSFQWIAPVKLQVLAFNFTAHDISEESSYLGVFTVALLIYFGVKWRKDRLLLTSILLAATAFVLSLGSPLMVNARSTSLPLPEALFSHVPYLNDLLPVRFSFVVFLFTAIALGLGGDHLIDYWREKRPRDFKTQVQEICLAVTILGAIILDIPAMPFSSYTMPWPADTVRLLNVITPGSVVLTYPSPSGGANDEAMAWQADDEMRFRLIDGYATVQGGADNAVQYAPLMSPHFVQEFLFNEQGSIWYQTYPRVSKKVNQEQALCTFIRKYDVKNVVYLYVGGHSQKVRTLFLRTLGAPIRHASHPQLLIWSTSTSHCN